MFDLSNKVLKEFGIEIAPALTIVELEDGLGAFIEDEENGDSDPYLDDLFIVLLDNKLKYYENEYMAQV